MNNNALRLSLKSWIWRWHIIGGLISLPFILLLCVTGVVYLFKAPLNTAIYQDVLQVERPLNRQPALSLQEQYTAAKNASEIVSVVVPRSINAPKTNSVEENSLENGPLENSPLEKSLGKFTDTTAFQVKAKGRATNQLRVNPYTGEITGRFVQRDTLMYGIRKLHGELLLGKAGTLVVELVASWFVVLLITGVYIWWPKKHAKRPVKSNAAGGVFVVRTQAGKRVFWRDLHAVGGFWMALAMLVILAGGMPWTDVFGGNLKWLQKQTATGYPMHWNNGKGLTSARDSARDTGQTLPLDLDAVANLKPVAQLPGQVTITLPFDDEGVYSVRNRSFWLSDQQVLHIDQYSGRLIKQLTWQDVGLLMDLRQVFMRLHQGEYGLVNWLLVLVLVLVFALTTFAAMVSYLYRKPKDAWGLPRVPASFKADATVLSLIVLLGAVFPLFGGSVLLIFLFQMLRQPKPSDKTA